MSSDVHSTPPRSSERRDPHWDVKHGPGNYATLLFNQAVSLIISVGAASLATHQLGAGGFGAVAAILAAASCVAQLALAWTAPSLVRFGCEEFVATGRASQTFWSRLLVYGANLGLVVALSPWWFQPIARWLGLPAGYRWLVLFYLGTTSLWVHFQYALQAVKLSRAQGRLLTFERAIVLALLGVFTMRHWMSPFTVAVAYGVAPLLPLAVAAYLLRGLVPLPRKLDLGRLRPLVAFSLPLIPWSIMGYVSSNFFDAFFIKHYMTSADLGRYSVAFQMTSAILQAPTLLGSLLGPYFVTLYTTGESDKLASYARTVAPFLAISWTLACGCGAFVLTHLVGPIFGRQFDGLEEILWALMAANAVCGAHFFWYVPIVNTRSFTHIWPIASTLAAVVNVVLDIVLIPRFGLLGCAWGTGAAWATQVAVTGILLGRRTEFYGWWQATSALPMVVAGLMVALRYPSHDQAALAALAACAALVAALVALHHASFRAGAALTLGLVRRRLGTRA